MGPDKLRRLADTSLAVCCGQVAECDQQFDRARSVSDYERSVRGKTAALLSLSCWLEATTAGADDPTAEAVAGYGEDWASPSKSSTTSWIFGDSAVIAKTVGNDVREGVFTLPVLLAIGHAPSLGELLTRTSMNTPSLRADDACAGPRDGPSRG